MAAKQSPDPLDQLRSTLRAKFGADFVTVHTEPYSVPRVSTGVIALDRALGGGLALGRMSEFFGKASSGKTSCVLSTMAQAQRTWPDRHVLYIDAEHALDLEWAVRLGINLKGFEHVRPESAEQGFYVMEEFLKTDCMSVIALDSVPASVPQAALDGDIGDANIGIQARIIAQCLPRILTRMSQLHNPPAILLINQRRANLQTRQGFHGFEPVKSTGGMALPYYMTTRLDIARIGTLKDALDDEIGQTVQVHVIKHKITPGPGAKVQFRIENRIGIDTAQELLDMAIESGEVTKSGAWYILPDKSKVQGSVPAKEWLYNEASKAKKVKSVA